MNYVRRWEQCPACKRVHNTPEGQPRHRCRACNLIMQPLPPLTDDQLRQLKIEIDATITTLHTYHSMEAKGVMDAQRLLSMIDHLIDDLRDARKAAQS